MSLFNNIFLNPEGKWKKLLEVFCEFDKEKKALSLIKNGANVKLKDEFGNTLLHTAAISTGSWSMNVIEEVLQLLIKNGADVNATNNKRETPLHTASINGNTEVTKILLENDADVNARMGNDGMTPLLVALFYNHEATAIFLIENGADVNAKNIYGVNAMHFAIDLYGCPKAIEVLEKKGVEKIKYITSPLILATERGQLETIKILIKSGTDINARDINGNTSLSIAASKGEDKIAEFLVQKGADLNAQDLFSYTALHWAAANRHYGIMETLITKGADVNIKTNDGRTAMSSYLLSTGNYFGDTAYYYELFRKAGSQ